MSSDSTQSRDSFYLSLGKLLQPQPPNPLKPNTTQSNREPRVPSILFSARIPVPSSQSPLANQVPSKPLSTPFPTPSPRVRTLWVFDIGFRFDRVMDGFNTRLRFTCNVLFYC